MAGNMILVPIKKKGHHLRSRVMALVVLVF